MLGKNETIIVAEQRCVRDIDVPGKRDFGVPLYRPEAAQRLCGELGVITNQLLQGGNEGLKCVDIVRIEVRMANVQ